MKYMLKLNAVSMLYALMAVIPLELMVNVYRISRLAKWEIETVNMLTGITLFVDMIGGTLLLYVITKKWLGERKVNFLAAILWLPYFILFIFIFASLFPITYRGDDPNPVTGLLMMGGMMVYPVYILILTSFSMMKDDGTAVNHEKL